LYDKRYSPSKGVDLNSYPYTVVNPENDIMIGMYSLRIKGSEYSKKEKDFLLAFAKAADPNTTVTGEFSPNNSWKDSTKPLVDTTASPVYLPVTDGQIEALNADTVVIFHVKIDEDRAFQGKYTHCKSVVMHKDYTGFSVILYFHHEGNKHLVDDEIARTWGVLKFMMRESQQTG